MAKKQKWVTIERDVVIDRERVIDMAWEHPNAIRKVALDSAIAARSFTVSNDMPALLAQAAAFAAYIEHGTVPEPAPEKISEERV